MNAQATRRGLPTVALWGGLGALAWAAITVLTGGSAAHADEESDPSLLGGVTSLVSDTVSSVGDTVTAVTKPVVTQVVKPVVTEVVAPVVTQVVAPVQQIAPPVVDHVSETVTAVPVAGPATAPVVEAVADTAQAVVAPVTDLLKDAPVSQIVKPVQDAVAALPVVGRLVDDLGLTGLIDDVVGVADATTDVVGGVVDSTVPPVISALDPTAPDAPSSEPAGPAGPAVNDIAAVAVGAVSTERTFEPLDQTTQGHLPASDGLVSAPAQAPATGAPASDDDPAPSAPPFGAPAAPSSSAGSSGASSLSHARLSDVSIPAFRAVERTPGAPDDVLPTSLVADTDVSPD